MLTGFRQYMIKAIKEAKVNSSWIEPNEDWEEATEHHSLINILDEETSGKFCRDLAEMAEIVARLGRDQLARANYHQVHCTGCARFLPGD